MNRCKSTPLSCNASIAELLARIRPVAESILNRLDFREFTCIDCLIDSIMNLREMAPPNCKSLSSFFNDLVNQSQSVQQQQIVQNKPTSNFKTFISFLLN